MIDVNVADTIYCSPFQLLCHPLDWWSSAASWAQAILSAAAIYFAALAATAPEKLARQRQVRSYMALLGLAEVAYQDCLNMVPSIIVVSRLRPVANQFAAITVENVPDFRLVQPMQLVHHDLITILDFVESYLAGTTTGTPGHANDLLKTMANHSLKELTDHKALVRLVIDESTQDNLFTRIAKRVRRWRRL
ncbi:TPA: hypothetical protein UOA92_000848 [Stenotrophomonas maltophilia]|nr:hypothetical protein [Stenotrophomonas maltophilia]